MEQVDGVPWGAFFRAFAVVGGTTVAGAAVIGVVVGLVALLCRVMGRDELAEFVVRTAVATMLCWACVLLLVFAAVALDLASPGSGRYVLVAALLVLLGAWLLRVIRRQAREVGWRDAGQVDRTDTTGALL